MDTYFGETTTLKEGEDAEKFAQRVGEQLAKLIAKVDAMPERPFPDGEPHPVSRFVYGCFALLQTLIIHMVSFVALLLLVYPCVVVFLQLKRLLYGTGVVRRGVGGPKKKRRTVPATSSLLKIK